MTLEYRGFVENFLSPGGRVGITRNCQGNERDLCSLEAHRVKGCFPKDDAVISGSSVKTLEAHRQFKKCQQLYIVCNVYLQKKIPNLDTISQDKSKGVCNITCVDTKKNIS